jgi:hypothetical protein
MDLSSLAELGKVAGVAGIALGMIARLASQGVKGAGSLPRSEQAPMLRLDEYKTPLLAFQRLLTDTNRKCIFDGELNEEAANSRISPRDTAILRRRELACQFPTDQSK